MCALPSLSSNEAAIQSHIGKALIKTQIDELFNWQMGEGGRDKGHERKKK